MKVAVMGAGAVGCFYGGMLARAGQEVVLIGRPRHVEAIGAAGLRFESARFDERVAVRASADPAQAAGADLVLVCVKSDDTPAAADALRPHLGDDAVVVSLQNGIDNAATLEAALGRPTIAAAVYVACEMADAGHLRHHGRGDLIIGAGAHSGAVAALFDAAGVPTVVSADVGAALWAKLLLNCAYNALSAIAQAPFGEIGAIADVDEAMRNIIAECLAVARAEGVALDLDTERQYARIRQTIPAGQHSSMAQDFAHGRATEIAHLNGAIVRRGAALGVPTPVNQLLVALIRMLERQPHATQSRGTAREPATLAA
ncbi:ketopantoate reductase family protein [Burkholderia sp. 3C]